MIRRMLFTVVQSAVRFLLTAGALTQPCLADPLQWQVNGHFYDVINQNISWQGANAAAASMGFNGMSGHLVTVTSARENVWLTDTFGANRLHLHWLGGFQTTGSPEPGGGWGWITGEPWSFTNWWPGEPNNLDQAFGGNEDALIFDHGTTASGKGWNDLNQNNPEAAGYVVEFEQSTGQAGTWVPISGHLRAADGTPICAMVLANGQYTFSCDGTGAYDLTVPRDGKGQITLFGFADGFAPLGVTLGSGSFPLDLQMPTAASNSSQITMTRSVTCSGTADWVRITGMVLSAGNQPLCAMVLANGQHLFSCGINPGTYDLAAPVARNGQMTIFAFADGFQPYRDTFIAPVCGGSNSPGNAVNPSSPPIGQCDQVSRGNSTVRLTNSGSTMIEAYFDSVPLGADMAPGECILVGIELPSSYTLQGNLEVTQCTPSPPEEGGCDALYGPTKYVPIILREGQTQTINIGSDFF